MRPWLADAEFPRQKRRKGDSEQLVFLLSANLISPRDVSFHTAFLSLPLSLSLFLSLSSSERPRSNTEDRVKAKKALPSHSDRSTASREN